MFEFPSESSSEPSDKEKKVIEKQLIKENEWLFMDTFSALPEEEKKKKIIERWKREKNKAKLKGIPWRMLEPKIENVLPLAGVLAGMTNRLLSNAIRNGGVSTQELAREASARARHMKKLTDGLHARLIQKRMHSLSPLTRDPIPNRTSKEIPVTEENPFDRDEAELPPEYTYLEQDTVTLPQVENGVGIDFQSTVVSGKINEYAKSEAERYRDDPETALSVEAFYGELNKMLERGDIDAALRFLDGNLGSGETNAWSNELRAIALQLGTMKREQYGHPKVDFDDATFLVSKNASQLFELYGETNEKMDLEGYSRLMALLERISDPTEIGERALGKALGYSEGLLAYRTHQLNRFLNTYNAEGQDTQREKAEEYRIQVEEAQRMRDAILQELETRKEQSSENGGEESPSTSSEDTESEEEAVPFDALLTNPKLELSDTDVEALRLVIQQLEKDVLEGGTEVEGSAFLGKHELKQLAQLLHEGTPEAGDKIDTMLSEYVYRTIFQKVKGALNRTDTVIDFETKKNLLELVARSDKMSRRHSGGRVQDTRLVEAQVDEILEALQ